MVSLLIGSKASPTPLFGGLLTTDDCVVYYHYDKSITLEIPALCHLNGKPFSLNQIKESQYELKNYPGYYLDLSHTQAKPFGAVRHFLSFRNDSEKAIHYLPVTKWRKDTNTSSIDFELHALLNKLPDSLSMNKTIHLVEYIENTPGSLTATSVEGSLYLAVLWLYQKKYHFFLKELKKIEQENLSKITLTSFMTSTYQMLEAHHDHNPEYLACACHLLAITKEFLNLNGASRKWVILIYNGYLQLLDRVPDSLKLDPLEECIMARYLNISQEWRINQISNSASLTSIQTIRKITPIHHPISILSLNSFTLPFDKLSPMSCTVFSPLKTEDERIQLLLYTANATQDQLHMIDYFIKVKINDRNLPADFAEFLSILHFIYCYRSNLLDGGSKNFCKHFIDLLKNPTHQHRAFILEKFFTEVTQHTTFKQTYLEDSIARSKEIPLQKSSTTPLPRWKITRDLDTVSPRIAPSNLDPTLLPVVQVNPRFNILKITPLPITIRAQEKETTIIAEFQKVCDNIKKGEKKLYDRPYISFPKGVDLLLAALEEKLEFYKSITDKQKEQICTDLNDLPKTDIATLLAQNGILQEKKTIEDAIYLFLQGSYQLFLQSNPYITENSAKILMQKIQQYLLDMTEYQHLQRLQKLCKEYQKSTTTTTRAHLNELIYETFQSRRYYNPALHPFFLVFEYMVDIRFREKQITIIEKMLQKNKDSHIYSPCLVQMMMGEGKTQVIAPILLAIAGNNQGCGIFITPQSQLDTTSKNLSRSLAKLGKKLYIFNPSIEDLSNITKLEEIAQNVRNTFTLKNVIITTPEAQQTIELEFLRLSNEAPPQEFLINELRVILSIFKTKGHAIIDEFHDAMNTLKEVNISIGSLKSLDPDDIDILQRIYSLLVSKEIKIGERSLQDYIGLLINKATLVEINDFKSRAIPLIARYLQQIFLSRNQIKTYHEELYGFLSQSNLPTTEFTSYLKNLATRGIKEHRTVRQIIIARHILWDILPTTLTKRCGRHYGRLLHGNPCKVVPYQGVDTPSNCEFGYPLEAACYQLNTALKKGIELDQIKYLSEKLYSSALDTMSERNCSLIDTPENHEFFSITGLHLSETLNTKKLHAAFVELENQRRQGNITNILKIETETIMSVISYHTSRLTSNPQYLLGMFASYRGLSGTPWNLLTYPKSIKENYVADEGTEGSILALLLNRDTPQSPHVHTIDDLDPRKMIQKIMDLYPEKPERVSMLLDPVGLFKDSTTNEIAIIVRDFLKEKKLPFDGVLFFTRPQKESSIDFLTPDYTKKPQNEQNYTKTPDRLAFLPLHSDQIVYLRGSDRHSLAEHGLIPGKYFVINDERHTIGTDILMSPDAVGVLTIDQTIDTPTLAQSAMRLRQLFYEQDVHLVISKNILFKFQIPANISSIIHLGVRTQSFQQSSIILRSFCQKVDHVARQCALDILYTTEDLKKMKEARKAFDSLIINSFSDNPLDLLNTDHIDPKQYLQTRFWNRYKIFCDGLKKLHLYNAANESKYKLFFEAASIIIEEAEQSPLLPKTPADFSSLTLGHTVQQMLMIEQQKEVTIQLQIENEMNILQELARIQKYQYDNRRQVPWKDEEANQLIREIKIKPNWKNLNHSVESFTDFFLNKSFCREMPFLQPFASVLDANILCTKNFACVGNNPYPLFHKCSRPILNLLLIACPNNSYKIILISLEETSFWTKYIHRNQIPGVFLIDKNGLNISDILVGGQLKAPEIPQDKNIDKLLVQVNAIIGNICFLNKYTATLRDWIEQDPNKILLIRYAVIHQKDPKQRQLFLCHLKGNQISQVPAKFVASRKDFLNSLSYSSEKIAFVDFSALPHLSPQLVVHLTQKQVRFLKLPAQIQAVPNHLVPYISNDSIRLIHPKQARYLTAKQIVSIQDRHIIALLSPHQYHWLTKAQIPLLSPHQIPDLYTPNLIDEITDEQLSSLLEKDIHRLTEIRLLRRLPLSSVQWIPDHWKPHLTPHQVEHLISLKKFNLTPQQIQEITDPAIIHQLSEEQRSHLTRSQMVFLSKNFIS